jgi:hypothetical protein
MFELAGVRVRNIDAVQSSCQGGIDIGAGRIAHHPRVRGIQTQLLDRLDSFTRLAKSIESL